MTDIPDILSKVSLATARECKDINESKNCNAKGDCYWAKVSSTNSKCFSKTEPNFASIIENDLYYTAQVPIDDSQYDVLNLLPTDKDNFIRLTQQNESFKKLIGNEEFMELLIRIRTDGEAYNTVVEFFKNRFSKKNLKHLIPIFLKNKLDEFEQKKKKKLRSGRERISGFTPGLNTIQELSNVPEEPLVPGFAGGEIPGNFDVTPSDGGAGAPPLPDGGEASGTEAPGATSESGAQKAEGQMVYESTHPAGGGDGGGVEPDMPVYANADRKRTPGLPTRKQPFNIEKEMIKSIKTGLKEQKFPGFWGQAEALN